MKIYSLNKRARYFSPRTVETNKGKEITKFKFIPGDVIADVQCNKYYVIGKGLNKIRIKDQKVIDKIKIDAELINFNDKVENEINQIKENV